MLSLEYFVKNNEMKNSINIPHYIKLLPAVTAFAEQFTDEYHYLFENCIKCCSDLEGTINFSYCNTYFLYIYLYKYLLLRAVHTSTYGILIKVKSDED